MALADVEKVQIIAYSGMKMELLTSIQEEGLIQIESADCERLGLSSPLPEVSHLDHTLYQLSHSIDYLSRWEEKGLKEKLFGQKPQLSRDKREEVKNFDYQSLLTRTEELENEENELLSQIKFLEKEKDFLAPLKSFDLPVHSMKPTDSTKIVLGFFPVSSFEEFQRRIEKEPLWCSVILREKRNVCALCIYLKGEESLINELLKEMNFSPFYLTDSILQKAEEQDKVKDVIDKIDMAIEKRHKKLEEWEKKCLDLFPHREKLMRVYDVLHNEREKHLSSCFLGETERALFLEGWIRSSDKKRLKSKLQPYSEHIEYFFRDPLSDEEPPAILENPKAGRPFELITKLYGLPQRNSMDPTLALAPFFFLFVGLTVSEAGYGLLVTLLSLLFIKIGKPKGGLRQFLQLLSILGVSTVILGTLVGGWFGFPLRKLMILDPLRDPVSFLVLSLALGFIQVWFGTLLNMISGIRNKDYLQAIFVQGGWLLLLPFLVLYGLTKQSAWGIITLAGAAGIVFFAFPNRNPIVRFFGGLYSLYGISRYLADILSYSRLLALGLATSVIAMVVNTLCQTALGIPWVGWLIAALIFVGGHLFNLGISFLGGFVHSMRLQFVEFFGKFFESGGKSFKPFEFECKYTEFI